MEDEKTLRKRIGELGIGELITIFKDYDPLEEHPNAPLQAKIALERFEEMMKLEEPDENGLVILF